MTICRWSCYEAQAWLNCYSPQGPNGKPQVCPGAGLCSCRMATHVYDDRAKSEKIIWIHRMYIMYMSCMRMYTDHKMYMQHAHVTNTSVCGAQASIISIDDPKRQQLLRLEVASWNCAREEQHMCKNCCNDAHAKELRIGQSKPVSGAPCSSNGVTSVRYLVLPFWTTSKLPCLVFISPFFPAIPLLVICKSHIPTHIVLIFPICILKFN